MKRFDMMQAAKKLTPFLKITLSHLFLLPFPLWRIGSLSDLQRLFSGACPKCLQRTCHNCGADIPAAAGTDSTVRREKILGWQQKLDGVWNGYRFDGRWLLRVVGDTAGVVGACLWIEWYFISNIQKMTHLI